MIGDYKNILQASFSQFWATLRYNSFLYKSIQSFLTYCSKSPLQNPRVEDKEHVCLLQEIYTLVFYLYDRMIMCTQEDARKTSNFDCYGLMYDQWLLDLPKIFDLIMIYQDHNAPRLKQWVSELDRCNSDYYSDFKEALEIMNNRVI